MSTSQSRTGSGWLTGSDATRAERALVWSGALCGVAFVVWQWWDGRPGDWTEWRYVVAALIAADLVGGAVANSTGAVQRRYFGPPDTAPTPLARVLRSPSAFTALHVYPFVIVALYPGGSWVWAITVYAAVVGSVAVVDRLAATALQRPVAMLLFCVIVLTAAAVGGAPPGWGWFVVVYPAKLLLAHAVRQAPPPRPET